MYYYLMKGMTYLKVIMHINTTPSNPDNENSSSSESLQAFATQPTEGISLSNLKQLLLLEVPSVSRRGT